MSVAMMHPQKSTQHVRACAAHDGAIWSIYRRIVPYHRDSPNTRNGARLWSPSLITAPVSNYFCLFGELQKCLKGKSDAYNELICIVQRVRFQVRVSVFNC